MNSFKTHNALGKKANILIVDDQPTSIRSLSAILTEEYTIMVATSGAKALEIARGEKKPELILLDIKMPEMDGYEVLRRINADESTRDIPVIFVTAKDSEGDEEFGLELGAVDYISKPYVPGVVKLRVKQLLERMRSIVLFSTLYKSNNDAIILLDDAEFLDCNPAALTIFGVNSVEAFCALHLSDLSPSQQEDGSDSMTAATGHMETAMREGSARFEWQHRRYDTGEGFPAEVCLARMALGGKQVLQVSVRDITAKINLAEQLRQSQNLKSIGRLAGGVAHEFNNILMGIMGYTDMCRDELGENHPIREWLEEIKKASKRSADLTRQLLAFARKQTVAPEVLELNEGVEGMLKMLRRLIGEDIDLAWRACSGPTTVKIDPGQIDQVLANLCVNARNAIKGVGKVMIETDNVAIDAAYSDEHLEAAPGDYIMLAVSDDGCGMDSEMLEHVFEPFYTTQGVGAGTGLGLATIYGIVKQNNGFVNVYSEPDQGTTFRIYLPHVAGETAKDRKEQSLGALQGDSETILLVEDEKAIRDTLGHLLERLGYTALVAEDPEQALRLVEEHLSAGGDAQAGHGTIDLLLTDVVMPRMSGKDLANKLKEDAPDVKVIYMSGYTANVIAERGILEEGVDFLSKPISREDLAAKLREVLGK